MRTEWMGAVALVLGAITLAVVLSIAVRPAPQAADPGPALSGLESNMSEMQTDIAALRADVAALRTIAERPAASGSVDPLTALQARFDSLDSALSAISARFATLCTAINSSPFAPSGGAC